MSGEGPLWLPDQLSLSGTWQEIIDRLWAVFHTDFVKGCPTFNSVPVAWDRRKLDGDPRDEGFWHIITRKDYASGNRLLDQPRAKRLRWARAVLDNAHTDDVLVFDYEEGLGKIRTYLWAATVDYVVILEKKPRWQSDVYFLVTAFCLDGPSRRRDLDKKYRNRRL